MVTKRQMARTTTKKQDSNTDKIRQALKKVKQEYKNHTLGVTQTSEGFLLKLKSKTHSNYNGFQSRPDMKIGLAVAEALKHLDIDPSLYQIGFKQGTEKDAVKVELRPFGMDRYEQVL